jgi:serine protease Do/serine protease DegQ
MKFTHSASRLITILAWLTAFCCSPAIVSAAAAAPAKSSSAINYTFDDSPLDRSNQDRLTSYADMLDKVTPGVVGVYPSRLAQPVRRGRTLQQYFNRYGTTPPAPVPDWTDSKGVNYWYIGVGSGCVISADGYILTNNHVVDDETEEQADAVLVKLGDGRELQAKIIGTDRASDLALIKIDAKNLPTIKMADSDKLRVGDIVFAVGNPMDVGMTVTHGIVSAVGRSDLDLLSDDQHPGTGFENFIQTDASINPGNSGGPLVDAEGRLVGLNSVIESPSGGSIGIGFAIPSTLARHVADDLMKDGRVRRGALGVGTEEVDHNLAEALHMPNTHGALLKDISAGSPAAKSGLQPGDVVVKINNDEVDTAGKLRYLVALSDPGTAINVTILRDGKPQVVKVVLEDREQLYQEVNGLAPVRSSPSREAAPTANNSAPGTGEILAGVSLTPVTGKVRQDLELPNEISGLVVTDVAGNSPYAYEFSIGTVITQVNKKPVVTLEDLIAALKPGELNLFYVYRNDKTAIVTQMVPGAAK